MPLPVLVVNDATGARHCGTLQLPRLAPPAPVPPSVAVLARLDPLLRAHGDALAAQTGGLDPERLSRTYAALMAELLEAVGMRVDAVELTPESLQAVLPGGGEEEGEDEMESENGDDGRAQLAELPEGLRARAGELRALKVKSTRLAKVPAWLGDLSRPRGRCCGGLAPFGADMLVTRKLNGKKRLKISTGAGGILVAVPASCSVAEACAEAEARLRSSGQLGPRSIRTFALPDGCELGIQDCIADIVDTCGQKPLHELRLSAVFAEAGGGGGGGVKLPPAGQGANGATSGLSAEAERGKANLPRLAGLPVQACIAAVVGAGAGAIELRPAAAGQSAKGATLGLPGETKHRRFKVERGAARAGIQSAISLYGSPASPLSDRQESIVNMIRGEMFANEGICHVHGYSETPVGTSRWIRFHLFRVYNIQQRLAVLCSTADKSAIAGKHYVSKREEVLFEGGSSLAYFDVEIINDE